VYRVRDANAAGEPIELTLLRSIELHLLRQRNPKNQGE
jgi:hypothetical protein